MTALAQHGPKVRWDAADYLLADIFDVLSWGNYQRARGKGARPKRYPRPGANDVKTYGKPIPIERAREILARRSGITRAS